MNKDSRPINVGISDLMAFAWPITAIASITHRIAGVVLFVGVGFALFALEASLASEESFNHLKAMIGSPFGMFVTWGLLAALAYHFVAGIKHLLVDGSEDHSMESGVFAAKTTLLVSAVLILLAGVWVIQAAI